MAGQLGENAPDFEARRPKARSASTTGRRAGACFSHPGLHAGVHTELGYMAKIKPEFDTRNVKIIGLSVDPIENHAKWAADIEETQGTAPNYPMIGDADFNVSKLYGMLPATRRATPRPTPADNQTVRNVFVVGPTRRSS